MTDPYWSKSLHHGTVTQKANEVALDAQMLVLLGVLKVDIDGATHIIILIVDWQLDLLLSVADLMVLLIGRRIELYVDLDAASQASEE